MALGSMSFNAQGWVPPLMENLLGMSCSGTCWLLGRAWFQCRYGGFQISSCRLMFPGVRSFLVFSSFGFKPPASACLWFSLIFTVASRLVHPYCTDDKTSRLVVKRFSTVRDIQRGSQSYMEKRRGRREVEMTRRRIWESKWERPI